MPFYEVTALVDASMSCRVKARSPEEAEAKACDQVGSPSICHQCSDDINVGDCIGALVYDGAAEKLLLDTTFAAERIRKLEAQVAELEPDAACWRDVVARLDDKNIDIAAMVRAFVAARARTPRVVA